MKFAELIDTRKKALAALEKRMAAKPSRELAEKLGQATMDAKVRGIEQRIVRLERQRKATLGRIDAALAEEQAALAAVRQLKVATPGDKPQPVKARTAEPKSVKPKPTGTGSAKAKAAKASPARAKATVAKTAKTKARKTKPAKTKSAGKSPKR